MNILATQNGAALITSLAMLGIMTVIGVCAMNSSLLEAVMAGNMQLGLDALTTAENNLAAGERVVEAAPRGDPAPPSLPNAYTIEFIGCRDLPSATTPGCGVLPPNDTHVYLYRITASGADAKGSRRKVQSIYATLDIANPAFTPGRRAWIDLSP